jgi:hypothetical protein
MTGQSANANKKKIQTKDKSRNIANKHIEKKSQGDIFQEHTDI